VEKSGAPEQIRRSAYLAKVELMFLGQFEHTIDEKGRMTIPARFREELGEVAYITRAFDQNLTVMPESVFEALADRLNDLSVTDPEVRLLQNLIFSNAARIEFDRSGRILIPQYLRDGASLQTAAVVVGQGKRFEIWSPDLWTEQVKFQNSPAMAQRFKELNLPMR
jgi:MraZ protein